MVVCILAGIGTTCMRPVAETHAWLCSIRAQESKLRELVGRYSEFINFPIYMLTEKEVEVPVEEEEAKEEEAAAGGWCLFSVLFVLGHGIGAGDHPAGVLGLCLSEFSCGLVLIIGGLAEWEEESLSYVMCFNRKCGLGLLAHCLFTCCVCKSSRLGSLIPADLCAQWAVGAVHATAMLHVPQPAEACVHCCSRQCFKRSLPKQK